MKRIKTKDIKSDSLENILLVNMDKGKNSSMSKDMVGLMISLQCVTDEDLEDMIGDIKQEAWMYAAVEQRAKASLTVKLDPRILVYLTYHNNGIMGKIIMYLYYLQYWAKKNNVKYLEFTKHFCMGIFPMGFHSEEYLSEIWEGQKVDLSDDLTRGSDNLIDYAKAAKSIQFEDL